MRKQLSRAEQEEQSVYVQQSRLESIFSLNSIKGLSNDEIIDRMAAIESQSWLLKSRLLWELRKRYPSDKEFGQYLNTLRNSTRPEWASSSSKVSRLVAVGRFCEDNQITDMGITKVYQGSLYELALLEDKAAAKNILKAVRNKNMSVSDVKRLIQQETVVHTIDHGITEVIDYEAKLVYTVDVVANVAQVDNADECIGMVNNEPPAQYLEPEPTLMVRDDNYKERVVDLIDSFDLRFADNIVLLKEVIAVYQDRQYPKK
jgi:hypothetical protein